MKPILMLCLLALLLLFPPFGPAQAQDCIPTRLTSGGLGRVLPGDANNLRDQPSTDGNLLGQIPGGAEFTALDGPVCDAQGRSWWQVDYAGTVGWTVEGQGSDYYVEPVEAESTPASALLAVEPTGVDCGGFASRLTLGRQGRVLPGDPLAVHARPNVPGSQGEIPAGGVFTVVDGPQCVSSEQVWWQVAYDDLTGWVIEGVGETPFVEPVLEAGETLAMPARSSCPDSLPTRLAGDSLARVISGGANRVRSAASTDGEILGVIPSEGVMAVRGGITCDGAGGLWRRIDYGDLTGWTIEAQGDSYFIEPTVGGGNIPQAREAITPDNLWQVAELARVLPEPDRAGSGRRGGIAVAWSPDGSRIAVTDDAGVLVYTLDDLGAAPRRFASDMAVAIYPPWFNAAFSPDGRWLAAGSAEGKATVWDVETGEVRAELPHPAGHYVPSVAFSPDGRWLATGSVEATRTRLEENAVIVWDTTTFEPAQTLPDFAYSFLLDRLTFSPDGHSLLVASNEGRIRLVDLATNALLGTFYGGLGVFSPDGTLFFTESILVQVATGAVVKDIPLSIVNDADFNPAGTLLLTASIEVGGPNVEDAGVRLWAGRLGTPLVTLVEADSSSAAFSPDGTLIAVLTYGSLHVLGIP